jgi:leucyl aminopeptidase
MHSALNVKVVSGKPNASWGDVVAVPVLKGKNAPRGALFTTLDKALRGALSDLLALGDVTGGDEVRVLYTRSKALPARVVLVGIGEAASATPLRARRAGIRLARTLQELKAKKATLGGVPEGKGIDTHALTGALVEGTLYGAYRFDDWKSKDRKDVALKNLQVVPEDAAPPRRHQDAVNRIAALVAATQFARDLGNRPCNDLVPTALAKAAREVAAAGGLKVTVLDDKKAEAEGMHAFCAVAKGSAEPPAFIIMEHHGGPAGEPPIVLIGKGLTFDTGGISLKPAENMDHMKFDMCGAGAVLGAMKALAELKVPKNVVMLIPAVENMPGGRAYKPGDVLKTLSGLTIEVRNTDAEGRVVLADALAWSKRYKPAAVIDLATLTGACVVALGGECAALFSNDDELSKRLLASADATGDRLWPLPLWDDYRDIVKSDVADVRNSTGRPAGAITAACFLEAFAKDLRWAHLDIAGTAYNESSSADGPKGATGFGVRLLVDLVETWPAAEWRAAPGTRSKRRPR